MKNLLCALGWWLLVGAGQVAAQAVPGGLYTMDVPQDAQAVTYRDRPVLVFEGRAVVGIALSAQPGKHTLKVIDQQGRVHPHTFTVVAKAYPEQRLTIDNPRMVNPDPESLQRIRAESARMRAGYLSYLPADSARLRPFLRPVEGVTSSPFGRRRVLNDQPRNPHSGLDIAAPHGTPILAPAPGKVTLTGDFYFNGNTVFLDHGQGLVTMYCHLSEIRVAEGAQIARGEVLGLVGATGRATGPHLHWSVSLNGYRVDPELVMSLLAEHPSTGPG